MKKLGSWSAALVGFVMGVGLIVSCGGGSAVVAAVTNAVDIVYDNATSGLASTTVQDAIDELDTALDNVETASGVSYSNSTSGLTASTVQAALDELKDDIDGGATYTDPQAVLAIKAADGAGSTLDADLLDGSSSAAFATIGANTFTGAQTATGFTIGPAKTGKKTIAGVALIPATFATDGSTNYTPDEGARVGNSTAATSSFAYIDLPDGATITGLEAYTIDAVIGKLITVRLQRYARDGSAILSDLATVASASGSDGSAYVAHTTTSISNATVVNSTYAYLVKAEIGDSSGLKIASIQVTYTYSDL